MGHVLKVKFWHLREDGLFLPNIHQQAQAGKRDID